MFYSKGFLCPLPNGYLLVSMKLILLDERGSTKRQPNIVFRKKKHDLLSATECVVVPRGQWTLPFPLGGWDHGYVLPNGL